MALWLNVASEILRPGLFSESDLRGLGLAHDTSIPPRLACLQDLGH